jgi:lysophospholipase L1-like esterase
MKNIWKSVLYVSYLLIFITIALEILLRIYNPIPFRIKGDKIVLPINQSYQFTNQYACFDPVIVHKKNSMGFRGEEMPQDSSFLKIITVGGSTTECFFITENKAWPQVMQSELRKIRAKTWVNNAGLNGHSSFGHLLLLKDVVLKYKPDYIYFLVGVNDMDRQDLNQFDNRMILDKSVQMESNGWFKNAFLTLANHSEVANLVYNLSKVLKARNQKIFVDKIVQLNPKDTLELAPSFRIEVLRKQEGLLPAYRERLLQLIQACRAHGVKPIMMTQPLLLGKGIDPKTGTDLAKAKVSADLNGQLYWEKLELYNEVMRQLCRDEQAECIDLAHLLPKDSRYFYDPMHFTNEGSIKVGQITAKSSARFLNR